MQIGTMADGKSQSLHDNAVRWLYFLLAGQPLVWVTYMQRHLVFSATAITNVYTTINIAH